jgi:DNA modification methylase
MDVLGTNPYAILLGDARRVLQDLPSESIQTIVTSPPYFGLRDYGKDAQIGLEETPSEYVNALVEVFREAKRVLREDGTLWLNLGDTYAGRALFRGPDGRAGFSGKREKLVSRLSEGLREKNLIGIPWRVAFALQADGWNLRQDIIWSKPNPMPEPVLDRCTKAHEYIFLMSKSTKYFYDIDAIREPWKDNARDKERAKEKHPGYQGKHSKGYGNVGSSTGQVIGDPDKGKNKRSVWSVTCHGFPGAHFATYPPELIRPCILAGSKPGDVVLDPFNGSGTTGYVALQEKRRYLGIELNPEYVEIANNRIRGLQIQETLDI